MAMCTDHNGKGIEARPFANVPRSIKPFLGVAVVVVVVVAVINYSYTVILASSKSDPRILMMGVKYGSFISVCSLDVLPKDNHYCFWGNLQHLATGF